jgi:penicillin-binding protein 1A
MSNEPNDNSQSTRRTKRRWSTIMVIAIIVFIVMITGAGLGFLTASIHTMPSLKGEIRPAASSQIFDINGKLITTIHSVENRMPVSLNKIPKDLQNAFIATEDVRFYQHIGVDPRGIVRAAWATLTNRGITEGASTITQQLARNALLTQDRTLKRKIQEAVLAIQIERQYTKNEILEMYLNQIYFGQGAYGVEAAARVYFGKTVENLTLPECAMLAGLPQSPNYYSPFNNLKAAKERQAVVLDQMVKYDYISQAKANQARSEEIKLSTRKPGSTGEAPYFVDYVSQLLIDKYGADAVYKEGLKVYTTLDLDMQRAAEKAMTQLPVSRTDAKGIKQPQGALVAIDPQNGYIKAMVGGRGNDQFNRAVLAERQPGSAFKPFVYLAGIESGMTPATVIDDKPISFGSYSPSNYDHKFRGPMTLRSALEQSINVVAVKVADKVGPDKVLYYAQQMGISTLVTQGPVNDRNLALALGGLTRGVTPLELASAYGVLANNGVRVEPTAIIRVVDRSGKVLEQHQPRAKQVVNERSAYLLTDMMRGVLTHGTGAAANIGRPAAGKTGTTSDYKDAWFVGFTPDLAAAVWMGFDTGDYLNGITGGDIPAPIWHDFMMAALAKTPVRDFVRPGGIVSAPVTIPAKDGKPGDPKAKDKEFQEIFIEGTQPKQAPANGQPATEGSPATPDTQPAGGKALPPPPTKPEQPAAPTTPATPSKPAPPKKN